MSGTGAAVLSRQLALPGWGLKAQEKVLGLRLLVRGQDAAAGLCRDYLGRAGVEEKAGDLSLIFDSSKPDSDRALLVSGAVLAFWSRNDGPCFSCLSKAAHARAVPGPVIRGALAADLALTWAAGLADWKPGRLLRFKPDFETVEEFHKATAGCPDCRGEA